MGGNYSRVAKAEQICTTSKVATYDASGMFSDKQMQTNIDAECFSELTKRKT